MPSPTFRIESVNIEGFKAFSKQQTFHFEGRHVFLFGPNGLGKTSIVEAIRWCLFGLASRAGEIVKNQFYAGPCIVQVRLGAPDGQWTMQRRLRSDVGGESDLTVRDPGGSERNLEEVFPQLTRIGPREGTHVIYAAQQPSSRRSEADITDFSYVVYRHLKLEEIPRLSDVLLTLSKSWQTEEDEICQRVEALGQILSERIAEVDESLRRLTSDPPWDTTITPTASDTRNTIDRLAGEAETLGAQCSSEALEGLAFEEKVYEVETAIESFFSGEVEGLEGKLDEESRHVQEAESELEKGRSSRDQVEALSTARKVVQGELDLTLKGSLIEDLEKKLDDLEEDLESAQLKLDVVQSSRRYVERTSGRVPEEVCPTCERDILLGELKSKLVEAETSGDRETKRVLEERDQLKERICAARKLSGRIDQMDRDIASEEGDLSELLERTRQTFGLPFPVSIEDLAKQVEGLREGWQRLQDALDSRSEAREAWQSRLEKARREVSFHRLRRVKERLQSLHDIRFEALHSSLRDLADLRDIAEEVRSLLNAQLKQQLSVDLPPVANEMTEVYLRLTGSPTFDSIEIRQGEDTDGSMTLDLRVSSSRGYGSWGVDQGILNGQALNAIQLVPYFVFSRYQVDPLLDLLLLDDPTQAFDTGKINLLLTELAEAASHATLFLATHEEDRFLPILKDFFDPSDVRAYRAVGMDEGGPPFRGCRNSRMMRPYFWRT